MASAALSSPTRATGTSSTQTAKVTPFAMTKTKRTSKILAPSRWTILDTALSILRTVSNGFRHSCCHPMIRTRSTLRPNASSIPPIWGKTRSGIVNGIPEGAYVRAVREHAKKHGLLYAGTELGVFVSFDSGTHCQPLQLNLPISPIHDFVVMDDDLVAATHGRSFWLL